MQDHSQGPKQGPYEPPQAPPYDPPCAAREDSQSEGGDDEADQDSYDQGGGDPTQPCPDGGVEPRPGGRPPRCRKPSDQLAALTATLKKQELDLTVLSQKRDAFQNDIAGLEQTVTEQAGLIDAYTQALSTITDTKQALDQTAATKLAMLECPVSDHKDCIEQAIADVDEWIKKWRLYKDALRQIADDAQNEAQTAAKKADDAQTEYDKYKTNATALVAKLAEIDVIRQLVQAKEDAHDVCGAYAVLLEMLAELETIIIRTPKQLEYDLCLAWTRLNDCKALAREAKTKADDANANATDAAWRYTEIVTKRREAILACVAVCCAKPEDESKEETP